MVYFLVLVVFVKVLVFFSEIGVVLVVFGSGGSETLNPTLFFRLPFFKGNFSKSEIGLSFFRKFPPKSKNIL